MNKDMTAHQQDATPVDTNPGAADTRDADTIPDTQPVTAADTASDADQRVLVDSVDAQKRDTFGVSARLRADRAEILPTWLRSTQALREQMKWIMSYLRHTTLYHALRIPKYAGKMFYRAPVGAARLLGRLLRWAFDDEGAAPRHAAIARDDYLEYQKLARLRDRRVRWRAGVTVVLTLVTVIAVLVWMLAPLLWQVVSAALITLLLATLGSPEDTPLLDTAVVKPQVRKLTSDVVVKALAVLGVSGINQALAKDKNAIYFTSPIHRDGPGWRAEVDLPPGVTVEEVADKRDKLAAGLNRPLGAVWPEGRAEIHPGRLVLWVGDEDMANTKQPAWPLLKAGAVDLFEPFPFGTDPRGRGVNLELMYSNLLIGSIPGAGKTFSLKVPVCAAMLDPRAELWGFELKGSGDMDFSKKFCTRYASGPDDPEIEQAAQALRDLRAECTKRAKTIAKLPKDICPENKVTPELASKKSLGLHPLVVYIDECQELFSHSEYGAEAGILAEKIIKLGRAFGVILLLATQRPDKNSLPTGVSANMGMRFCLRVMGQTENDMVLGTSSYKNGIRATMFTKRDKGVGYLVGMDEPQINRTYFLDGSATERICHRAWQLREKYGTLPANTPEEASEQVTHDVLRDVASVIRDEEEKIWNETVVQRLSELKPDLYADWLNAPHPAEQLSTALKPYNITTAQVWALDEDGKKKNRRGIHRDHIHKAVTERNQRREGKPPSQGARDSVFSSS